MLNIESVDEIADVVGRVYHRGADAGGDWRLQGKPAPARGHAQGRYEAAIDRIYRERLQVHPGAAEQAAACKRAGLNVLLVSGGFTHFADRLIGRLGIDFTRANVLDVENGLLTGRLLAQP